MKFKIGKGPGHAYQATFGTLSADLTRKDLADKTLKQIAMKLAQQNKIVDGEINLISLEFRVFRRTGE